MSMFVLLAETGEEIVIDGVFSNSKQRSATLSTTTVFNGSKISDHYKADLPQFTATGRVCATKTRQRVSLKSPQEFTRLLDYYMDQATRFTYIDESFDQVFGLLPNIMILSYNLDRSVNTSDSLDVTLQLGQIDISTAVKRTTVTRPRQDSAALTSDKASKAKNGSSTENTKKFEETTLRKTGTSISDALSGNIGGNNTGGD